MSRTVALPVLATVLTLACSGPTTSPPHAGQSPEARTTAGAIAFSVPLEPFVEDCSPAGCSLESTAPFSFDVNNPTGPALPAQLPVTKFDPLTGPGALASANQVLGPGWEFPTPPPDHASYLTDVAYELLRGGERATVRGRTMTVSYLPAGAPTCGPNAKGQAVKTSQAWLIQHGVDVSGLAPKVRTTGCGELVDWSRSGPAAGLLDPRSVTVAGGAVTAAEIPLAPRAVRQLGHEPFATALRIAVERGQGPPVGARAEFTYLTQLGNDGAWYRVPAASVVATAPGGASGRVVTAYASMG